MELHDLVELHECSICEGAGLFEEDGNSLCISCLDCGARTVSVDFTDDASKLDAAKRLAGLWNSGKVISEGPGE